jgi:uncharacterized membrane protein
MAGGLALRLSQLKLKFAKAYYWASVSLISLVAVAGIIFFIGSIGNAFIGGNPLDWKGYALMGCIIVVSAIVYGLVWLFKWSEKVIDESNVKNDRRKRTTSNRKEAS